MVLYSVVGWGETEIRYPEIEEELVTPIALLALGVPLALHLRLVHLNVSVTITTMGYIFWRKLR